MIGASAHAGYPVRIPSLEIETVGAGGGSIAWSIPAVRCGWDRRARARIGARLLRAGRNRAHRDRANVVLAG